MSRYQCIGWLLVLLAFRFRAEPLSFPKSRLGPADTPEKDHQSTVIKRFDTLGIDSSSRIAKGKSTVLVRVLSVYADRFILLKVLYAAGVVRHTGHFATKVLRAGLRKHHHCDENERTDGAVSYVPIAALTTT